MVRPQIIQVDVEDIAELAADTGAIVQRDPAGFVDIQTQNPTGRFAPVLGVDQFKAFVAAHGRRQSRYALGRRPVLSQGKASVGADLIPTCSHDRSRGPLW